MDEKPIYFKDRKVWRKWLEKNHNKKTKISMLVYKKHTGKSSPTHREAMEEAICFGWIDTIVKRVDEDTYTRGFSKRTEKSRWSNATLSYGKEMIAQGKMSPHGLKMYKLGLAKPVIDHGLGKNPEVPEDLQKALDKNKKAKENFKNLAPSYRRIYIVWVATAKLPETRKKRIKKVVENVKEGKKWGE